MIFPKRESNPAVLEKLVERIKVTNSQNAQVPSNEQSRHVIIQRPGKVPELKGPWPPDLLESSVRELYQHYPDAQVIVMSGKLPADCFPQHGQEFLDMLDADRCLCEVDELRNSKCPVDHSRHSHETREQRAKRLIREMATETRDARDAEARWLLSHAITRESRFEWTNRRDAWLGRPLSYPEHATAQKASERRAYHANGTYWSGVPTVDMPCDFCGLAITAHDPRTHACPTVSEGDQRGEG